MADTALIRDSRDVAKSTRGITLFAVAAYIAVAAAVVLIVPGTPRATAILGIAFAAPLVASGLALARIAARRYPARMARYWRMFGTGCAFLGGGLAVWCLAAIVRSRPLALVGSVVTVTAMPLFVGGLFGRIKTAGGLVGSKLDVLDLGIVMTITGGYVGFFLARPVAESNGLAVSVLLCGGLVLTVGVLYAAMLLLRRGGGAVRRADRFILVPFITVAAYQALASLYLMRSPGSTSPWLYISAYFALAPLPLTPMMDSSDAVRDVADEPIGERSSLVVALALLALVPLIAAPLTMDQFEVRTLLMIGVTIVLVAAMIAARQFIMLREIRHLGHQRVALASLWKRDAARAESLLGLLRQVAEGKDLGVILEVALEAAVSTTRAERALFIVRKPGANEGEVIASRGLSSDEVIAINETGFDPVSIFRPFAGGRAMTFVDQPVPGLSDTVAGFGKRSLAAVAVTGWDEGRLGAFCCDAGDAAYDFTSDDIEMLEAITDHVTLNLSQSRLFRELAASEERYRMLVEDATDGVCELDLDDRILFTNSAFADLVGRPAGELPGRRLEEVVEIETDLVRGEAGVRELIASVTRGGETAALEVRMSVRRDGRVQAVMRDVTERTRAAERIESLYRALEQKEQARTAALAQLIRATEDERSRVAADLHDGPVQALSTLAIRLDLAKTVIQRGQIPEAEKVLADVRKQLSQEVIRIRHLMMELRPPVLDERGLFEAIENYAKTFELETGIGVRVLRTGSPDLDKTVETVLYRIMQEALTNVRKHSKATEVAVTLAGSEDGCVSMEISDNGIGLDHARAATSLVDGHIGLTSMRERAELAGGELTVNGAPGEGTTIRVNFESAVVSNVGS